MNELAKEEMAYKSAKEWGLPSPDTECWICGNPIYGGETWNAKCHGYQEIEPDEEDRTISKRFIPICTICFQVQITINRDSLHKDNPPNCWKPIKRMFLCNREMTRIAVWEVLDCEPWLKQIQKLPSKE